MMLIMQKKQPVSVCEMGCFIFFVNDRIFSRTVLLSQDNSYQDIPR